MLGYTIGADISKDHIDLHLLPENKKLRVTNDRRGFSAILRWIDGAKVERVVYEPTGAYHKKFEHFMFAHGLPLCKVNPRYARRFAEASGRLAKTDAIDAEQLARFGLVMEPAQTSENTPQINQLKELNGARLALIKDRTAAKNRSKDISIALLKRQNEQRLKQIERHQEALEKAMIELIKSDEDLKNRFEILTSIRGISAITAFTLLAEMPELGSLDEKTAAALSGLAPMNRQSGRWSGRAFIAGGRAAVRKALYMPALVASRSNPTLTSKYQQLIGAGKAPKVALTAIMRKLIVLANALLRDNRKWRESIA